VEALVARDPFAIEGLIKALTIIEWDPLFRRLRRGVERTSGGPRQHGGWAGNQSGLPV